MDFANKLTGKPVPIERVTYLADFFGHWLDEWDRARGGVDGDGVVDPQQLAIATRHLRSAIDVIHEIVPCLKQLAEFRKGEPGRWFRILAPDGSLWLESSDEDEARAEASKTGWPLERLWVSRSEEWRADS